ncbi:Ptc2 phosphatase [Candida orthopsilosis Co 90-125]|uniref:protein-serine/threonine phosphatase n=1 Tax=Candida orthopsilosis (strain 90-125) TaxID=1136231 RepID=H8WW70_CANO9|nr:Ptc2 phosphatase [Candida orthopsilosis Co 90-125]CCG20694.1 Ptc2 phosphatase [Candida orthopsilosis Co 90-125]
MGQILSQPITEKHSEEGQDKYLAYGLSSMQGWRINMEDAHATVLDLNKFADDEENKDDEDKDAEDKAENDKSGVAKSESKPVENADYVAFFGVYDGHGGEKAALFTGEHLHKIIRATSSYQGKDYTNALKQGFLDCDQAILKDIYMRDDDSGCAATTVLITPEQIFCGNAGDSRTIMSVNGVAKALSFDHKPSLEGEKSRIMAAGGYVDADRVNGNLALSRSIADFEFKKSVDLPPEEQVVTCYPDVITHKINLESDEFVVLACDGIWDCMHPQQVIDFIRKAIREDKTLEKICEEIMDLCCSPTSDGSGIGCDNMSIVIVALLRDGEGIEGWKKRLTERIGDKDFGDSFLKPEHPRCGRIEDGGEEEEPETGATISLEQLLSGNAVTTENGVVYLDTASAQSLLERFK